MKEKKKYPYLADESGAWVQRKDVRYVQVMQGRGGGMGIGDIADFADLGLPGVGDLGLPGLPDLGSIGDLAGLGDLGLPGDSWYNVPSICFVF